MRNNVRDHKFPIFQSICFLNWWKLMPDWSYHRMNGLPMNLKARRTYNIFLKRKSFWKPNFSNFSKTNHKPNIITYSSVSYFWDDFSKFSPDPWHDQWIKLGKLNLSASLVFDGSSYCACSSPLLPLSCSHNMPGNISSLRAYKW